MALSRKENPNAKLQRTGAYTATETLDLGIGYMANDDDLLVHLVVTGYSAGNVTASIGAIVDGGPSGTRLLTSTGPSGWTGTARSANGVYTEIFQAPLPGDLRLTLTGASSPSMNLAVYTERVTRGR